MYDFNVMKHNNGCVIEPLSLNAQHYCKGKTSLIEEINGVVQATNKYPIKSKASDFASYLRQSDFTVSPAS